MPDLYTDAVALQLTPFGVLATFSRTNPSNGEIGAVLDHTPVVNLRMSLEHAKVLAILLNREVHKYEAQVKSPIVIHPLMIEKLGIKPEDWK